MSLRAFEECETPGLEQMWERDLREMLGTSGALNKDLWFHIGHANLSPVRLCMKPLVLKAIQRPIVPDEIQLQAVCCASRKVRLTRQAPVL